MDEIIRKAQILYNNGDKSSAQKLLVDVIRQNPNNSDAWYELALCVDEVDRKIYCLKRSLDLNPSNLNAQKNLDQLQEREKPSSAQKVANIPNLPSKKQALSHWSRPFLFGIAGSIIVGMVGFVIIIGIIILSSVFSYKPNTDDAFSYAAGFALSEMYANDPLNYSCVVSETKEADYWYEIKVSDLGNGRYYVIGAMKAINQYCIYNTGYFAITVHYDFNKKEWRQDGEVFFSNSCMTVTPNDSGGCTNWIYGWEPDMNWRPPK